MITKLFEIRDAATFIPVMAIQLGTNNSEEERYLITRAGYGMNVDDQEKYILLIRLDLSSLMNINFNYREWGNRTFKIAHKYIDENFNNLKSGDVIDVEFILGHSGKPKISERFLE